MQRLSGGQSSSTCPPLFPSFVGETVLRWDTAKEATDVEDENLKKVGAQLCWRRTSDEAVAHGVARQPV